MNKENDEVTPSRRDRLRPLELLGFSAVLAVFASLIVAMTTRDWALLVPITAGGVFIVSAMALALIGLGMKPNAEDVEARKDLQNPSAEVNDAEVDDADGNGSTPNAH
ncbi:MAG: ABC transporter ATP-binding protein [Canibacter sp.]